MSFLLMSDKIVGECEAIYPEGKCRNEASRDPFTGLLHDRHEGCCEVLL